jgi:CxxC-x17-CxxC domain-containing protein
MSFVDKQLTCRDCGNSFLFTGGEQEFYASKGLQNEPVRCPPCRSARKSNRLTEPEDGYVKYGVFASFGGRTPRQMHPATCADCGMMTEVPFQPRGDRPVYCSNCYNKIKGAQEAEAEAAENAALAALAGGDKEEEPEAGANALKLGELSGEGEDGESAAEEPSAEEGTAEAVAETDSEEPAAAAEAESDTPEEAAEAEEASPVAEADTPSDESAEEEKVESVAEA